MYLLRPQLFKVYPKRPTPDASRYYVVALNHRAIRLYRGNERELDLVHSVPVPWDMREPWAPRAAHAIRKKLARRTVPIVLAGSPLMRRLYRETCGHPWLATEEVPATLGLYEARALHKATWPIARRALMRRSAHAPH